MRTARHIRDAAQLRAAYTLVEVLAVTIIIGLLVAVSVPAFSSLAKSSNASLADTQLRLAIASARDAAIQSLDGRDAAAVFFYEPGGRISIEIHREVGTILGPLGREYSVFARDAAFETVQLPRRQHVVALALGGSIVSANDATPYSWYSTARYPADEPTWVFPESDFYDQTQADEGALRSTFMVRFEAVTGAVSSEAGDALVFAPASSTVFRQSAPFNTPSRRPDRNPDQQRLVQSILFDPSLPAATRERLVGDLATDTVLTRPVRELALYHVNDMARTIRENGATGFKGVDKVTGCLYTGWARTDAPTPMFDWADDVAEAINEDDVAQIFIVDRYTGSLNRLNRNEE